jgi:hypothetical protein
MPKRLMKMSRTIIIAGSTPICNDIDEPKKYINLIPKRCGLLGGVFLSYQIFFQMRI